jgi:hypothetical protein
MKLPKLFKPIIIMMFLLVGLTSCCPKIMIDDNWETKWMKVQAEDETYMDAKNNNTTSIYLLDFYGIKSDQVNDFMAKIKDELTSETGKFYIVFCNITSPNIPIVDNIQDFSRKMNEIANAPRLATVDYYLAANELTLYLSKQKDINPSAFVNLKLFVQNTSSKAVDDFEKHGRSFLQSLYMFDLNNEKYSIEFFLLPKEKNNSKLNFKQYGYEVREL